MTARIFLHPVCARAGPAEDALDQALTAAGYDTGQLAVHGRDELHRLVSENADGSVTLERFDGIQVVLDMPKEAA